MARTENDTWDLASSVGATATMVAAARAMATNAERPLIDDPFAEPLVRAVGVDLFTRLASGDLLPQDLDADDADTGMQRMTDNMAVRTKFFDEFFLDATTSGIRQVVILASGLDSRAYRLAVARGHHGLRDRPARGHRLQDPHAGRARRRADRRPPHSRDRPALRLADGAGRGRLRPQPADRVERRGPARLPAAGRPGPAARHHHRAQRARQPVRHRKRARRRPRRSGQADRAHAVGGATLARARVRPGHR